MSYDRAFGYSPEGQLLGHIAIAIRMIADKLRTFPDFPVALRNLIEHMVLSHHGQLEFGSPKIPIFPEALLLHYLDDMDSKMECMRVQIDRDPQAEGYFSAYSPSLGRVALRKTRYLESNPAGAEPAVSVPEFTSSPELINETASTEQPHNPAVVFHNNHSNSPALNSSTIFPGRSPLPAPPNYKPAPATNSIFGSKLQQALHDERK